MESDEVKSLKNALFDTSKDFLQLKQCFEEELISKSNELSIFITKLEKELKAKDSELTNSKSFAIKLEKELKAKDSELTNSKPYAIKLEKELKAKDQEILLLLEKISDLNNKNKIFDEEKYYTNRL